MQTLYTELAGPQAAEILRQTAQSWSGQSGFLGAELLHSPAQPGLMLLTSHWENWALLPTAPAGAKQWAFAVLEAWPSP